MARNSHLPQSSPRHPPHAPAQAHEASSPPPRTARHPQGGHPGRVAPGRLRPGPARRGGSGAGRRGAGSGGWRKRPGCANPFRSCSGGGANERGVRAPGEGEPPAWPHRPGPASTCSWTTERRRCARRWSSRKVRLPPGAPDDMLPPPDLLWAALGVVYPSPGARFAGGDRLEDGSVRLRYGYPDGTELHYQVAGDMLPAGGRAPRGACGAGSRAAVG